MALPAPRRGKALYSGIILAFGLWFVIFVLRPLNFWLMLSLSTSVLATIALVAGHPLIEKKDLGARNIFLGLVLAGILYAVFWCGNQVLGIISYLFPSVLPHRAENIRAVYANTGALDPLVVAALLFFPIGFGEEVFWRGFVQREMAKRWSGRTAFIIATLLYAGIHLPTGNPVLILAALSCGIFWGSVYQATGSLVPVLISHMVWDPLIFILFPIK